MTPIFRSRSALKGAALALGMLAAAAGGTAGALAAPAGHAGQSARSTAPLANVGLGWSVAQVSASTRSHIGKTTLYAVSPQGRKFAFYSWLPKHAAENYNLVDFAGDGQRVLLVNPFNRFEQINLISGQVVGSFRLPVGVQVLGYTRPMGQNVLALTAQRKVVRYNLAGQLQKVLATQAGLPIDSPDGTTVIVGEKNGIEQVANTGGVIKRLHAPVPVDGCEPLRWWNSATVLAACSAMHGPAELRLWLFPVNGGRVRALTPQRDGRGPDLGDVDAWKLTSGVYTQALGACGTEFIAKLGRGGSAHQVSVPGYDNIHIVTGHGSSLLVQAQNPCGIGRSLLWFNPATRSVSYVVRVTGRQAGVVAVVPYGRPLS